MNNEEALKMVVTEFTYVYPDGDEIQAYIKKFDEFVGLTCISLEVESRDGWKGHKNTQHEDDGTFCVIGLNIENGDSSVWKAFEVLKEIRDTGRLIIRNHSGSSCGGCASCSFV